MSGAVTPTGEIGTFLDVMQMQPGKSQFMCGYFSGAILKSMGPVGGTPQQTVQQMIAEAEAWYAADHGGDDSIKDTMGMTVDQEYNLIVTRLGMHFQASRLDLNDMRAWVRYGGYPLMLSVEETSVFDLDLGKNPYPWTPAGSHIIVLTGITSGGHFLVRDPANCTSLYDPNSLRPGPRRYDATKLQVILATVVVPSWLPRPTSNVPPPAPVQGDHAMDITDPWAAAWFQQTSATSWHCPHYNTDLTGNMLAFYQKTWGAARLPTRQAVDHPTLKGVRYQVCESGIIVEDPNGLLDSPGGSLKPCFLIKLTDLLVETIVAPTTNIASALAQVTTAQTALDKAATLLQESHT